MTASTEVARTTPLTAARQQIRQLSPEFALVLGGERLAERFVRVALTAVGRNPKLADCTDDSLLGGLLTCAQLRLEPNDPRGLAYLIPFENRKARTVEAQLVIGYKGLVDLAYRSGQIKTLAAEPVHKADEFREQRWPRELHHRVAAGDRGDVVCYYAAVEYRDGGQDFTVMSVDEIERHRDLYSKGHQRDDSPWKTAFDAMARKTVLRRLAKMMPLSVEDLRPFAAAINVDGTSVTVRQAGSVDELMSVERPQIEAPPVESPSRVTAAEIQRRTSSPSVDVSATSTEGATSDACPGCGAATVCDPTSCPATADIDGDGAAS